MALEYVKFFRGIRDLYDSEGEHLNGIYFATDTKELLMNGEAYGTDSGTTITYEAPDKLYFNNGIETTTITLQTASAGDSVDDSTAGLISAEDIYKLATALDNSQEYTDEQIAALRLELTNLIDTEESRAEDREDELDAAITAEATRATAAENTLQSNIDAEVARATAAEETLQTNITAEETRATAEEEKLQDEIDNLTSDLEDFESATETNITNAISTSETYTDTAVNNLKTDLESQIAEASSGSTEYTDNAIDELDYTDTAVDSQFVTAVNETNGKISVTRAAITGSDAITVSGYQVGLAINGTDILSQNSSGLKATLSIDYNSSDHTVRLLGYDGVVVSQFSAEEFIIDGMITDAKLVTEDPTTGKQGEFIAITFNAEGGQQDTIYIDVTDLIDTYTSGNGVTVNSDNTIDIKIADSSESYLTVSSAGLKVDGIDSAISSAVATETTRAEGVESDLQSQINSLSGSTSTDISALQSAVQTAQTTADKGVSDAATASTAASNAQSTANEALSLAQEASSTYVKKAGDTMTGKLTISTSTNGMLSLNSGTAWEHISLTNVYNGLNNQTLIGHGNSNDFIIRVYNEGASSYKDLRINCANSTVKWNSNNLIQSSTATTIWTGTESAYNALSSYDSTTLYIIKKS